MTQGKTELQVNIGGRVEGVDLLSFLQMMNNAAKTCTLRVTTEEEVGFLHLSKGNLIAAETSGQREIQAAYEIIGWENVGIEIENIQENKQITIKQPLMSILLEGSRLKDEKNRQKASQKEQTTPAKADKYEILVDQYVAEGNTQAAVKLLYDVIIKCAKARDFQTADRLRDKLQEVDAWALDEIVKSGEVIDAEKVQAIDQNHMRIWSKLYRNFTTEEANELFFNLKSIAVSEGKLILQQGKLSPRLYFIDMGQVSTFFRREEETSFVSHLEQGGLIGVAAFFTLTVSTESAVTRSNVKLYYLNKKAYEKLEKEKPSVSSKLKNYCLGLHKTTQKQHPNKFNRRIHPRYRALGEATLNVTNPPKEMATYEFKTNLADISLYGISAEAIIPNLRTASALLGRAVTVRFHLKAANPTIPLNYKGWVVAVMDNLFNNYMVGIKLGQPIHDMLIESLKTDDRPM